MAYKQYAKHKIQEATKVKEFKEKHTIIKEDFHKEFNKQEWMGFLQKLPNEAHLPFRNPCMLAPLPSKV